MVKTLSQQIKNGGYSDNFISVAGNITQFTATITEAPPNFYYSWYWMLVTHGGTVG